MILKINAGNKMSYLKDFIDGFIDGWINLLNLNPIEDEPTLTWLESKSVEEALGGDISAIAGDFKNAMEKVDKIVG